MRYPLTRWLATLALAVASTAMLHPGSARPQRRVGATPSAAYAVARFESPQRPTCEVIEVAEMPAAVNRQIRLCQMLSPASPHIVPGVDCISGGNCELGWDAMGPIGFDEYAQGEYVGRARIPHVPQYRLRVDDDIQIVYRLSRRETAHPYELNVGDEVKVESLADKAIERSLIIQPDGTISLPLLGQVRASRHTVIQLRDELEDSFKKYYKVPAINITPIKVNTKLEDLRASIDRRAGVGGQDQSVRITPEGTIGLPGLGSVAVQGLTLEEMKRELDERYAVEFEGMDVTPVLLRRAPRYVFVLGEVRQPGRYSLEGPTTVMQSIAMAGSWNVGANINHIVVFRRAEDWRLIATKLDLRGALQGKRPCPAEEIWVSDADLVIVPKSNLLLADNFIDLVFTRGLYGVVPINYGITRSFTSLSTFVGP